MNKALDQTLMIKCAQLNIKKGNAPSSGKEELISIREAIAAGSLNDPDASIRIMEALFEKVDYLTVRLEKLEKIKG